MATKKKRMSTEKVSGFVFKALSEFNHRQFWPVMIEHTGNKVYLDLDNAAYEITIKRTKMKTF